MNFEKKLKSFVENSIAKKDYLAQLYIFSPITMKTETQLHGRRDNNDEVEAIRVLSFNVCVWVSGVASLGCSMFIETAFIVRWKMFANETLIISDRNPFIFSFRQYENNFSFVRRASQIQLAVLSEAT